MEKTHQETHDFMNVDSFSQLPFNRPSPTKEKSIRLFGKEVGAATNPSTVIITDESDSTDTAVVVQEESSKETGESKRKFECHYCCRNFPTSQALGGHQNAHKRERQHAKRAHLQSAMFHGSLTAAQMYGLTNYHRTQIIQPSYYHHHQQCTTYNAYSTTNITNNIGSRFYGGNLNTANYGFQQTPIDGSPLAMWRSYPTVRNSSLKASRVIATGSNSQIRYSHEQKSSVQDQVSLDLHL